MNSKHNLNITKPGLAALRPGGSIVQHCATIAAFQTAYNYAQQIRRQNPRDDGYEYVISSDSNMATVTVSLRRKKDGEDRP